MANGGIVAEELLDLGSEPRQPGALGDRRQLLWIHSSSSAVPPFVRPIASEHPPILESHEVPEWDRGDDNDKIDLVLQRTPRATLGGGRGVLTCGFPRVVLDLSCTSPHRHIIYRMWGSVGSRGIGCGS